MSGTSPENNIRLYNIILKEQHGVCFSLMVLICPESKRDETIEGMKGRTGGLSSVVVDYQIQL